MTLKEVRDKSKIIAKQYNINVFEALQRYMFERILERISVSKYRDNFILKGGVLLSAIMGIENRTTKDIDTSIKGIDISKEKMVEIINEILKIDLKDGVVFEVVNISDIRENDKYGGNKYEITCYFGDMKINLSIDISTGDVVTPHELKYSYQLAYENRSILINSYNLETILSEKIETILRRGKNNSRMKDFYDVYYFLTNLTTEINCSVLQSAIKNTFEQRNSLDLLYDYEKILNQMLDLELLKLAWRKYQSRYYYARNISLNAIIITLKNFILELNIVLV